MVDLVGVDEVGCRRILEATKVPSPPIDVIAVTAADPDLMPVPVPISDDKQCEKKTTFLRMISRSRPPHE
jgi:hypothetical protein